jgi:hypothetical protein
LQKTGGREATVLSVWGEDNLAETLLLSVVAIRQGKGTLLSGQSLLLSAAAHHLDLEEILLTLGDVR